MKKIKVALIHNIISPYRIPLFNKLSKNKSINLTVYFLNETASNRKWNFHLYEKNMSFNYKVLPQFKITLPFSDPTDYNVNLSIFNELRKEKFDVIIGAGWVDFACQTLPFLKKLFGYKYILWAGSTKDEPSFQRKITLPLVKSIVKKADFIISYGTKSKKYLTSLGASPKKVFPAFNPIDVDSFKNKSLILNKRNEIRKKYGIESNQKIILYVGQFIERKNVELLINAISRLERKDLVLVLQGYGELKSLYVNLAKKMKVDLKILPYVEVDYMPFIYSISDLFILPSKEEVWGLVVNEAMACRLPVIVSDKCGCVLDLIEEGANGFSFENGNVDDLFKKMNSILSSKKTINNMKKESLKIIEKKDIVAAARVFDKVIKSAIK